MESEGQYYPCRNYAVFQNMIAQFRLGLTDVVEATSSAPSTLIENGRGACKFLPHPEGLFSPWMVAREEG